MYSDALDKRLDGIQKALVNLYNSGGEMSAASRGREREQFIDSFLKKVMPPSYRFGSGDAIDANGNQSGQLDVVVEFTFLPSIPSIGSDPRIYLAEGIAAVIEVKSNIQSQWKDIVSTSEKLKTLQRQFESPGFTPYGKPSKSIPIFAVGYTGWKDIKTVREKSNLGVVDGILVIDKGLFSTRNDFPNGLWINDGPRSLWGLISCLHLCTNAILVNSFSPIKYIT